MRNYNRFESTTPEDIAILFGDLDFKNCLLDFVKSYRKDKRKELKKAKEDEYCL